MMKSLVKEVPFGKGVARVEVSMFDYPDDKEVVTSSKVQVILNGKVIGTGYFAKVLEFDFTTDTYYARHNMDTSKKYTKVGDNALTLGEESGLLINSAIEEMKAELAKEFNVETQAEKKENDEKEEVAEAQAVITQAEAQGIQSLMSDAEIKSWKRSYNDLHNEGGEGYIPSRVSREQYETALKTLSKEAVV